MVSVYLLRASKRFLFGYLLHFGFVQSRKDHDSYYLSWKLTIPGRQDSLVLSQK